MQGGRHQCIPMMQWCTDKLAKRGLLGLAPVCVASSLLPAGRAPSGSVPGVEMGDGGWG